MQTDLNIKVFKLKSGELLIANIVVENSTMFNIEYPANIHAMSDRVMLIPFIPAFIERHEELMKRLIIEKDCVMWDSTPSKQMINMYSDFMLKVQSSFSGIQLVGSLGNTPRDFKIKT